MKVRVKYDPCKVVDKESAERKGTLLETRVVKQRREYCAMCVVAWDDGRVTVHQSRDLSIEVPA